MTPTLHTNFGIPTVDNTFPHHPKFAAAAGTDEAHAEAMIVGKSLALVGWDMMTNDGLYEATRRQWQEDIAGED